jgi:hypothetical protein
MAERVGEKGQKRSYNLWKKFDCLLYLFVRQWDSFRTQRMEGSYPENGRFVPREWKVRSQRMEGSYPENGRFVPGELKVRTQRMEGSYPENGRFVPSEWKVRTRWMEGSYPENWRFVPGEWKVRTYRTEGSYPENGRFVPREWKVDYFRIISNRRNLQKSNNFLVHFLERSSKTESLRTSTLVCTYMSNYRPLYSYVKAWYSLESLSNHKLT